MRKALVWSVVALALQGCAFKTRQIDFFVDPKDTKGVEVLVDVVYIYPDSPYQTALVDLNARGSECWFTKQQPYDRLYDTAKKDTFRVRPTGDKTYLQYCYDTCLLRPDLLKNAVGIAVIAEYGDSKPDPKDPKDSRGIVFLRKDLKGEPKPRKVENIFIGPGYLKRLIQTSRGMEAVAPGDLTPFKRPEF